MSINIRPWVFGATASANGTIFVMTDGQGGRLQAFDHESSYELLNIKPRIGGFGMHAVLDHDQLIVTSVATSRDWSKRALQVVCMKSLTHRLLPVPGHMLAAANSFAIVQSSTDLNEISCIDVAGMELDI